MTETSGKARALTAMAGRKPDQIPIFVSAFWDYWVRSVGGDPFDYVYGGEELQVSTEIAAARRHAGVGLHRTSGGKTPPAQGRDDRPVDLPPAGPPPWTQMIERHLPHLVQFDEAPPVYVTEPGDIDAVLRADRALAKMGNHTSRLQAISEALGHDMLIAASGFALFPHTRRALGGIERAMIALLQSPALVEAILDAVLQWYDTDLDVCAAAGAHAAWNGAYNEGADMINPVTWRSMIYPRHERFVQMCHQRGLKAILWFLGDCMPLLEDIVRAGYDALMLEQSRIGYSSDVGEMRRRVGLDLCLSGWVPELAMLHDDRDEIQRHIQEQVQVAGRDGAFLFSTSMVDSNVSPDTVDFFCEQVTLASP